MGRVEQKQEQADREGRPKKRQIQTGGEKGKAEGSTGSYRDQKTNQK